MRTTSNGYRSVDITDPRVKEAVDLISSQTASLIERDVLYLTGIPKEQNEKYFNYLKRSVQERFDAYEKVINDLNKQIELCR